MSVRITWRAGRTEFISTASASPTAMLSGTVNTMNKAVLSSARKKVGSANILA